MIVGTAEIKLYARWVGSIKEKRMVVKSILAKARNKFNISIAEIDEQDTLQTIVIGIACVTGDTRQADSIIDHVISFIEGSTEAEILNIQREHR